MTGKVINGFSLKYLLGEGGMADVWYAENSIGKAAAVKILKKEYVNMKSIVDRFANEAKVMVRLNHANIRQVYDYGTIDEYPCIVMEYLEGSDLSVRLKKGECFDSEKAARWWNLLVGALAYTHKQGVVHRDIKPSNIFITNSGDLKLLDFGIAKIKDSITITKTGSLMGTLMYMSPEQVEGRKQLDYRSDIYSLAVTFYHLLTGSAPYDSTKSSEFDIQLKIVKEPLRLDLLPAGWKTFLQAYLDKNPEERPELRPFDESAEKETEGKTRIEELPQPKKNKIQTKPEPVSQTTSTTARTIESAPANKPKSKLALLIGIAAAVVVIAGVFLSESLVTDSIPDRVEINGVVWATRNVGKPGKFVNSPTDYGEYYTWDEAQKVCPPGWRLPTKAEFESLVAAGSVWTNKGRSFANGILFLPAGGYSGGVSSYNSVGSYAHYWSSTLNSSSTADGSYGLYFNSSSVNPAHNGNRSHGRTVRCVAK